MRYTVNALTALVGMLVAPGALAQVPPPGPGLRCPQQLAGRGDLGFRAVSCNHCSFFYDPQDPSHAQWEFRSEPVIEHIVPGGPAAGRLQSGDVLVSIDGYLITTIEGGRRFSDVTPGQEVVLRLRRDDREFDVTIEPGITCPDTAPPTPPAVPQAEWPGAPVVVGVPAPPPSAAARSVPRTTAAPTPDVSPTAPGVPPPGWLGFSLSCSFCGTQQAGADQVWTFSEPPLVESVEPGSPAQAAGLRGGDRLTHLDGVPITSVEGGRRFGSLRAGERVRVRLERDGAFRETDLVVGERGREATTPTSGAPAAPPASRSGDSSRAPQQATVRFTGFVGDAFVEVTGAPVTVTETDNQILIRSGDITVRIQKTAGGEAKPR